jgi:23S rRNA pseudouridine1911/1915/1917 synthase
LSTTSIEVPAALDGERVDRALALITGESRTRIAELISTGSVRLEGRTVKTRSERVHTGARLEFEIARGKGNADRLTAEPVPFRVVFEDADLVVVDKPPGVVVHPGAGRFRGTLAAGIIERYPDVALLAVVPGADALRPGIVHRLDKDTSGLLVVARSAVAYRSLGEQMARRDVRRNYLALVFGAFDERQGSIEAPIGRSNKDRKKMAVVQGGRDARTRYTVIESFSDPITATLLEVSLDTGRTHQIRVHLSAIGHPVVGDLRYGGKLALPARARLGLERPFLHAARLSFSHPTRREEVTFESPLPDDLRAVLVRLQAN